MQKKTTCAVLALLLVDSVLFSLPKACQGDVHEVTARKFCYDSFYRGFSAKKKQDTAVVIIGYNRPHYFRQLLNSLATNPESNHLPFFFILDGGPRARQNEYVAIIKNAPIKYKHIIKRPFNYGLHWNIIAGLRFMFDWCGFKRIIHFEEDIVVTPTYLELVLKLDTWAHAVYDNIGAVQAYFPCRMGLAQKEQNLDVVGETANYWLGYCMRKSIWDEIKDIPYEYEHMFLKGKAWAPSSIQKWMRVKMNQGRKTRKASAGKKNWSIPLNSYYTKMPEMDGTQGQCGILTMSLFLRGYSRLATLVNRAINIGVQGTHYNKELWLSHFKGITLDHFPEDRNLTTFRTHGAFIY